MSPILVEIGAGILCAVVFAALRMSLIPFLGDRAPYAFVFLGVVAGCVLAGWRSGLIALVLGQFLIWLYVVGSAQGSSVPEAARLWGGLTIATISQLAILIVIALYQREVGRAMAAKTREMDLLSEALNEIDHRTRNNYQTVVALILLQAQRAEDPKIKRALAEAADRVRAVSLASDQLALRSEDLGTIRLGDHLRELCEKIKRGLAGDEVLLRCDIADLTARADTAIHLSIIVNELVTNALKHAFDGNGGEIRITCEQAGKGVELVIADNGSGMKPANTLRSGLGTRLVERFVQQLEAKYEVTSTAAGTTHRILVEHLA